MSAGAALKEDRSAADLKRGWCPGALRPMASGDGLIARLRILGGALTPKTAQAIADMAKTYGNGAIDLTARANLQIRGLSEHTLPPLQSALDALGLIDAAQEAEAVRNIVAAPLAGYDPAALLDIRPSVAALDRRLRQDHALWRLPGKFSFLIDDGGRLPVAEESADIGFVAERKGAGVVFAVRLAGRPTRFCAVEALADIAAALASAFLGLRGSGEDAAPRMAALVERGGVEPILSAAGLNYATDTPKARNSPQPRILGEHDLGRYQALGVGAPFGRLDAAKLALLAAAGEAAHGELRLTPWRAVLIVGAAIDPGLARSLRRAGFVLDDDDPIRAVAACPGAPSCAKASTLTQRDARRLAPLARRLAPRGIALHVSGCLKGCAHGAAAAVTLIGRNGRYDLALNGRAGDEPALVDLPSDNLAAAIETLADAPDVERASALRVLARKRS